MWCYESCFCFAVDRFGLLELYLRPFLVWKKVFIPLYEYDSVVTNSLFLSHIPYFPMPDSPVFLQILALKFPLSKVYLVFLCCKSYHTSSCLSCFMWHLIRQYMYMNFWEHTFLLEMSIMQAILSGHKYYQQIM